MSESFQVFSEEDGNLVPIEFSNLPITPKRIFYVTGVPKGETRGRHAHHKTKQVLICVRGEIEVTLVRPIGNGHTHVESTLLTPNEWVFVDRLTWDYQRFLTGDDILLSICSTAYDPSDYIEDITELENIVDGHTS